MAARRGGRPIRLHARGVAASHGRDMTNDVGLEIGGGGRTFQSRTRAADYDAGGISYERGTRYGVQFSYFMGN